MAHAEGHHGHHIIPFKVLTQVFLALVALTIITVLTAQINLGAFNVPLALAIALTKAGLVVTIFMALKYDRRVNALTFGISTIFVLIFIVVTLFDTAFRGDLGNVDTMTVQERTALEEELRAREPDAEALQVTPPAGEAPLAGEEQQP